jgi:hypothetical protein
MTHGSSPAAGAARVRRPEWVAHVLDDASGEPRAILLHLPRGERVALSRTGTSVWQLIVAAGSDGISVPELVPSLAEEYQAEPEVVTTDVQTLIDQLLEGEWVESVTEGAGTEGAGTEGAGTEGEDP